MLLKNHIFFLLPKLVFRCNWGAWIFAFCSVWIPFSTLLEQCFPALRRKKKMYFWKGLACDQIKAWKVWVQNPLLSYLDIRGEMSGPKVWSMVVWFICLCPLDTLPTLLHPALGFVVQSLSHVWLFVTPWTIARQAPLPLDFPGKNTIVGCHFLLQGIFLTQGSNRCLLHWQSDSLPPS